jgi:hypothetical protein
LTIDSDRLLLRGGAFARGKISVAGQGASLHLRALGLTTPVLVRLKRDDAPVCWEATFTTPTGNGATQFKARSN